MRKFELTKEESMQAALISLSMGGKVVAFMQENDMSLDTMIGALGVTLGALLAQREQVMVENTQTTTNEMIHACIAIMRKNAINSPSPSSN